MSEAAENPLRKWRNDRGLNLDEACALLAKRGYPISSAKLSRMERDQGIPLDELALVQKVTGIPAKELAPAVARIFEAGASQ
jgi:hypothetical protein